ncbi:hypothetical protein [Lentilactobacillus parabuchneri]|uniref:hypothetical protein n=1 Tax=Lentilactobacillus parabuchneri TaxID=152331 RepID=UPI00094767B8|nr:hypothetical protein [Lentilactobacillus parabuchneri]APR07534.1 Phosphonoacetaldehyde hydrolase [Lentilactobacillus parabuchneri]
MIKAIVFDWAGTTVDYGSQAPIIAFQQAFESFGITVPTAEIRADLGLDKLDHVKKIMAKPDVQDKWREKHPNDSISQAVDQIYRRFQKEIVQKLFEISKSGVGKLRQTLKLPSLYWCAAVVHSFSRADDIFPTS